MKALITGGTGLLGTNLKKERIDEEWFYPKRQELDITNKNTVDKFLIENKFNENDVVLHAAALTGIKECEKMKHQARLTNVTGTENLVRSIYKHNCHIIYISTDYVFKGQQGNYKEGDKTDPTTYYGLTKLEPEKYVLEYGKSTVIRTSFCKRDKWIHPAAFDDKFSSFIMVDVLAKILIKIIEDKYRPLGLLHIGGKRKSFYQMAKFISPDIGKISLKDMKLNIPVDTSLDSTRFNRIYGKVKEEWMSLS